MVLALPLPTELGSKVYYWPGSILLLLQVPNRRRDEALQRAIRSYLKKNGSEFLVKPAT